MGHHLGSSCQVAKPVRISLKFPWNLSSPTQKHGFSKINPNYPQLPIIHEESWRTQYVFGKIIVGQNPAPSSHPNSRWMDVCLQFTHPFSFWKITQESPIPMFVHLGINHYQPLSAQHPQHPQAFSMGLPWFSMGFPLFFNGFSMVFLPKPFPSIPIPSQRHPIHPRQGALEVGGAVFDQQRSDVEATRHDEEHDACWTEQKTWGKLGKSLDRTKNMG